MPITKTRQAPRRLEDHLQQACIRWFNLQYPNIPIYGNAGANNYVRPSSKADQGRLFAKIARDKAMGAIPGWPDLSIPATSLIAKYGLLQATGGLYIELKHPRSSTASPFLKSGKLRKDKHILEQASILHSLSQSGQIALFAVGFEQFQKTVNAYFQECQGIVPYHDRERGLSFYTLENV